MDWIASILFGLVSGLTEILPVSADAHQALVMKLFGITVSPPLQLAIHIAVLIALYQNCAEYIGQLFRERRLLRIPKSRRKRQPDMVKILDFRVLRTATLALLLGFLVYPRLSAWSRDLHFIAPVLVINGILLYIPMHIAMGNKDARAMSMMDSILLGLSGTLAVVPGLSRVGILTSSGVVRGADREQSLNWALLLTIPAMVCLIGFDGYSMISLGMGSLSLTGILQLLLSAGAAFGGAYAGIQLLRFMAVKVGFSGFAYYCWGAALFSFVMYLTV